MTDHDRINDEAAAMLLAPAREQALRDCLSVLLRMIPEAIEEHGLEQTTQEEHDDAIEAAATALYGEDRAAWPLGARQAAEGKYE